MRLGQVTQVAVEGTDLTLLVRVKWGEYKAVARSIAAKTEIEALVDIDAFLARVIADVRGLVADDGTPAQWSPELLEELTPGVVLSMFKALMSIGEAGSGDPLPETAGTESSATSPAG